MDRKLPVAFLSRMRHMMGFESVAVLNSLQENYSLKGLRINTMKLTSKDFLKKAPCSMEPVPWVGNAFFCPPDHSFASDLLYRAGAYYLQEPSAMTPADRLPVEPGDRVLDMCAAPGGKATALAEKLNGKGLLVANEVNASRAKALLYNLEVFGVSNALVTNEYPHDLVKRFPEYFDKILVDAPCSGEGMFRKDENAIRTWSLEKVKKCASIQKELLRNAVDMLRPGGLLMYSTCTFSLEENEMNVCGLLESEPTMHLVEIKKSEGFSDGVPTGSVFDSELKKTVRLWPHKVRGEGHFMALFKKEGEPNGSFDRVKPLKTGRLSKEETGYLDGFFKDFEFHPELSMTESRAGRAFLVPELPESARGIRMLRNGLYLGDFKKNRFEPSQALALFLNNRRYGYCVDIEDGSESAEAFLNGGNITGSCTDNIPDKSWVLVTVSGLGLGWSKKNGQQLKNKYLWKNK